MTSRAPSGSRIGSPPVTHAEPGEAASSGSRTSAGAFARLGAGLGALTASYAAVLFAPRPAAGVLFFVATFIVPAHGLAGLLGLFAAEGWARLVTPSAASADALLHRFNGLLVGLALGHLYALTWPLVGIITASGLVVVLLGSVLTRALAGPTVALPPLSLPFVAATWLLLLAASRLSAIELTLEPVYAGHLGQGLLPEPIELYLRALGAIFFQLNVPAGALVFVGLLLASRWATLTSILGFAVGSAVYLGLGGRTDDLTTAYVGFNFIVVAIALGGAFVVPSTAALLLAAGASALTAIVAAAHLAFLAPLDLPVLAFPFILVTLVVLHTLGVRPTSSTALRRVAGPIGTPEDNVTRAAFGARRYPDPRLPLFFLPVSGPWVVTQAVGGSLTHRGAWAHAWDFEVAGDDGRTFGGDGRRPEDFLAWGAPVVAPADGTVVRVVDDLPDNPVGEVDLVHNWGNLVILWHGASVYSALCHLQRGSVAVREGAHVIRGQLLGRVGASGRAPVPHLHFQAQISAEIGARTRPAQLLHYVESDGHGPDHAQRYRSFGMPPAAVTVRALVPDEVVRRVLVLPPGTALTWRVTSADGQTRSERWSSRVDPLGLRELVADVGARLGLHVDPSYLTTYDFEHAPRGRWWTDTCGRRSLLGLFHLGTPRVPQLAERAIVWDDQLPAAPWVSAPVRALHALLRPFTERGAIRTRSRAAVDARGLVVTTELDWSRVLLSPATPPQRIEVVWRAGGPALISAWTDGREVLRAEVVT